MSSESGRDNHQYRNRQATDLHTTADQPYLLRVAARDILNAHQHLPCCPCNPFALVDRMPKICDRKGKWAGNRETTQQACNRC